VGSQLLQINNNSILKTKKNIFWRARDLGEKEIG
jgi:hypothetical protein